MVDSAKRLISLLGNQQDLVKVVLREGAQVMFVLLILLFLLILNFIRNIVFTIATLDRREGCPR